MKLVRYPMARDAGTDFPLALYVEGARIYGESVPKLLIEVLKFLDHRKALGTLRLPFHTSGQNFYSRRSLCRGTVGHSRHLTALKQKTAGRSISTPTIHASLRCARGRGFWKQWGYPFLTTRECI